MLHHDRIDISEGIDVAKSHNSKECIIFNYCFVNRGFEFQNSVCNGCYALTMLCLNLSDTAVITVKGVDYCCIIHDTSKSEAIHFFKKSVLDDGGYI